MTGFDEVWQRINALEGEFFHQKTGRPFTYVVTHGGVRPSTANRLLARSQFMKAHERSPLKGPGELQDLQGPSYLYAILSDPRVTSSASMHEVVATSSRSERSPGRLTDAALREGSARSHSGGTPMGSPPLALAPPDRLGHLLPTSELSDLGFRPLDLLFERTDVPLAGGLGCEWNTTGDVPEAPGLYAFAMREARDRDHVRVVYVGMTEHLWMVTKGYLPQGAGARGGQRYGRPTYAGRTRQRVNLEIRRAHVDGWTVQHWVRPYGELRGARDEVRAQLRIVEEALITRWALRLKGWNRG